MTTLSATPEQYDRLFGYIVDALHRQRPQVAQVAAQLLDRGAFRVVSSYAQEHGEVVVSSLCYDVELEVGPDEWVPLIRVHWSALGLNPEQVLYEHEQAEQQLRDGTYPGGPFDE